MNVPVSSGWGFEVDEGPEWLFLCLHRNSGDAAPEPPVAAQGWSLAQQRSKRRIVFELGAEVMLTSFLLGQLILIHKRAEMAGGVFRLCNFPSQACQTLKMTRMADRFPNYATREDAVLGRLPTS